MAPLPLARFIRQHRAGLDAVIAARLRQSTNPRPTDDERRLWVLNDEPLYRWWQTNSPSPGDQLTMTTPTKAPPELTERQAREAVARILGPRAQITENTHAATRGDQIRAHQQLPALEQAERDVARALDRRRETLLAEDAEYQSLLKAFEAARVTRQRTANTACIVRYEAGAMQGGVAVLYAKGNTWGELVADLKRVKALGHLPRRLRAKAKP